MITVPASKENGLQSQRHIGGASRNQTRTHMLMSFRSHLSPSQVSFFPRSLTVVLHEHAKHIDPALRAHTQAPWPLHVSVELMHSSAVVKHVDAMSMGGCGSGDGTGACGACRRWCVDQGEVSSARLRASPLAMALSKKARVVRAARAYCSLDRP